MNFILRHLGWFLLGFFFIFMIFLMQDGKREDMDDRKDFGSGKVIVSHSGEKMETHKDDFKNESGTTIADHDSDTMDKKEEKPWFFERIFGSWEETWDDIKNNTQSGASQTSSTGSTSNISESTSNSWPDRNINDYTVKGTKSTPVTSIKKGTGTSGMYQDTAAVPVKVYPKTPLGTQFSISTYSLKLNDATFSKALAYLLSSDVLEQTWNQNSYGCFQAKIIESENQNNIGKVGYVCKKYLKEIPKTSGEKDPIVSIPPVQNTFYIGAIGQKTVLTQNYLMDGMYQLEAGDSVETFWYTSDNCAIVYVHETIHTGSLSFARAGKICK